jgi:hypothetical protein
VAWIIGIDEAGYGPNLGPFVMTAVACRLPPGQENADLWDLLRTAVRRPPPVANAPGSPSPDAPGSPSPDAPGSPRLLIADSKVVYSTARGLAGLERGVLATVWHPPASCLATLVDRACPEDHADLKAEAWYRGTHPLLAHAPAEEVADHAAGFAQACAAAGVCDWRARSAVVCPRQFNALVDAAGSKGAVLAHALGRLLRSARSLPGAENLAFFVDKHGGRNTYAAFIQDALPGGAVVAREEGMARSTYEVVGLDRAVCLTFQPRAETASFCVALASMASKYLRELFMLEFNAFWQQHVPGLKATAGYPIDAARFLQAIRPAARKLGIDETALWRRK